MFKFHINCFNVCRGEDGELSFGFRPVVYVLCQVMVHHETKMKGKKATVPSGQSRSAMAVGLVREIMKSPHETEAWLTVALKRRVQRPNFIPVSGLKLIPRIT